MSLLVHYQSGNILKVYYYSPAVSNVYSYGKLLVITRVQVMLQDLSVVNGCDGINLGIIS
jgi:hypothetical protein